MILLKPNTSNAPTKPISLGSVVPRGVFISCIIFWLTVIAITFKDLAAYNLSSILILTGLVICSSAIVLCLGVNIVKTLQVELKSLAHLARRDQANTVANFQYSEFDEIAGEIQISNSAYRDEMENLRLAAYRDTITGLPNRLSFIAELKKGLENASRENPCTILHIIMDGHKGSGDMLGTVGNQRLQTEVSSRISLYLATACTGPNHMMRDLFLASLGAGQFGIFLPAGRGREEAKELVRELRHLLEQPFVIDGRNIRVTLSGGLAVAPEDGNLPELLLKNAGLALNEILRVGKTGFQFFSPRLERLALGRTRFEQELRDAVSKEAFHPVFQPKVDLTSNKIVGVEALARWQHSEGRSISPGTFIPLSEELGLVDEIGFQILRQSCIAAAGWFRDGMEISVAVNVSPSQFDRPDFIDQIVDALRASGLPPRLLELEITETMAVSNPERVINVMKPLRAMGIKLAVDDFGTGHANLSLLTQIPFDIFKIDRQFVMGIGEDAHAPAIIEMTLAMAETLGLKTVAEGIETEEQAKFLRDRNCDLAQGFLYSPGIADEKFRELMAQWGQNPSMGKLSA